MLVSGNGSRALTFEYIAAAEDATACLGAADLWALHCGCRPPNCRIQGPAPLSLRVRGFRQRRLVALRLPSLVPSTAAAAEFRSATPARGQTTEPPIRPACSRHEQQQQQQRQHKENDERAGQQQRETCITVDATEPVTVTHLSTDHVNGVIGAAAAYWAVPTRLNEKTIGRLHE